jgi:NAD(P)H-dependent flavin oxidoreductase YrpB (nitropropane dioxygenase family)
MVVALPPPYRKSVMATTALTSECEVIISRYGAAGVWVGTRFVASEEAGAPPKHKQELLSAGYDDTVRTLVYSGRPMSVRKTPYVAEWYISSYVHMFLYSHTSLYAGKVTDSKR